MANVSVLGTITNSSYGNLNLPKDFPNHHDWFGQVVDSYPSNIPQRAPGTFTHKGEVTNGSVAAVIYSGISQPQASEDDCGWLVAWEVHNTEGGNRVRPSSVTSILTFLIENLSLTLVNLYN